MGKKTFVFNTLWREVLRDYPAEVRLEVYEAIMDYVALGIQRELKPLSNMAFQFIKHEIDYNNEKYDEVLAKRREAGRIGAEARLANQANAKLAKQNKQMLNLLSTAKQTQANVSIYDNVYVNDNDNVNVNVSDMGDCKGESESPKAQSRFMPPTIEQVQAYCKERGNSVDAQRWIDHYTSNGWMVGKNKMKDWKAAVRTWEKNGVDSKSQSKPSNLGVGEWMDGDRRTYGSGATTIPIDAPARPSERYGWSKAQGKWIIT